MLRRLRCPNCGETSALLALKPNPALSPLRVWAFSTRAPFFPPVFLLSVFLLTACSWFAPKSLSEAERHELARRLKAEIEWVGGSQVWVKGDTPGRFLPPRTEKPVEVLTVSVTFDPVLSAIKSHSEREGLAFRRKERREQGRWRTAEVWLSRRRQQVGCWRVREVRQLQRAAIVIDDLGEDLEPVRKLLHLPCPLTFAVLPHLPHSTATAEEVHGTGREVMLHLPTEPEPGLIVPAGRGEIRVGMPSAEVARVIQTDLDSVPYVVGVNNHMGSRATADPKLMTAVMKALAERRLYFVDSRTTPASVALQVARRMGLPAFSRAVFLDDVESVTYTLGQLRLFRGIIEKQGAALAIGHPHPTTLAALARFLPELERADIQVVPASQLVHLPEVTRLSPPGLVVP